MSLTDIASSAAAMPPARTAGRLRIPPNVFGTSFGLVGLAECWHSASERGLISSVVPDVLLILAALTWAASVVAYVVSAARHRGSFRRDLTDATLAPFLSLAWIAPMLLVALGLAQRTPTLAEVLVDVLILLVVVHGSWFTGQLFYGDYVFAQLHPGYFLPTVAGGLVAAAAAGATGQQRLGVVMLGFGLICWAILGSLLFARLVIGPMLSDPLIPTIAIEVAPAAVATNGYIVLNGGRIDLFVELLAGYGVLMALAQLRMLPKFFSLKFGPGFWAFTFAWAAVANAALFWIAETGPAGEDALAWLVLLLITVLIGGIAARSVLALSRGHYFPRQ